ncbi:UDP-N-acetylmuramoyl-tripeptide--D-alanyl-D-alanine ligase [Seonamhaeicola sp. S2-3]|uniref:UDP-N-acetylmuramoyl-tripeptide--D-alanyl-D- alanine ligase n=1 Tax=Seonamhaeicola sp. S2-3 TaxID=1936081 RepID=UPI0009729060|nr:UDP-N-acetylmuramoyl-tripeptide--D-alanyl-D-alanine ligase [Seonamhaeicola sp. S2-3]APY10547.1 UDP-N-acetylmuramoyl-tripeptide--D-alanyl-D-alanine ligase [Seonamhaeicola sp. S2-3]
MNTEQLHKLFLKCKKVSTDTRKIEANTIFFALKGENFNGNQYATKALEKGAKYAIVDEEEFVNAPNIFLVDNVLEALQKLASFHRDYLNIPIIALTGSNGKTTTKELINTVLSKKYNTTATIGNLNNHIGVPLTLLSMNNTTEIGIIEMGANHLKEIEFLCTIAKPDFGYITNFGKAHLEGFGGIQGVIKGKSEMYNYLIPNNKTVFVNTNDAIQVEKTVNAKTYSFGNESSNIAISLIDAQPYVKVLCNNLVIESHLIGEYNFNNIAAAIAIGNYFKVDATDIKIAIENYIPSNNRSQIINKGNIKIILDAYNANPSSMKAALLNFEKQSGKKAAILGDMFELGNEAEIEHQNIVNLAISLDINKLIFIGENFYKTNIDLTKASKFKSFNSFKTDFDFSEIQKSTLLIKGSRGMALERVLDLL